MLFAVLAVVVNSVAIALAAWTLDENFLVSILTQVGKYLIVDLLMVAMNAPAGLLPKWSSEVQICKSL